MVKYIELDERLSGSLTSVLSSSFENALAGIRKRSTRVLRGKESLTATILLLQDSSDADSVNEVEMSFVEHALK